MTHRHLTTTEWTPMAIESLFERGALIDWRQFAHALRSDSSLIARATRVAERHEDRGSVAIFRILANAYNPVLPSRTVPPSEGEVLQREAGRRGGG